MLRSSCFPRHDWSTHNRTKRATTEKEGAGSVRFEIKLFLIILIYHGAESQNSENYSKFKITHDLRLEKPGEAKTKKRMKNTVISCLVCDPDGKITFKNPVHFRPKKSSWFD